MSAKKKRRLWTCPKCRHKFVTRNLWHSCGRYRVADHFKGKDPVTRKLFQAFKTLVRTFGPSTVYAQKTRLFFRHERGSPACKCGRTAWNLGYG